MSTPVFKDQDGQVLWPYGWSLKLGNMDRQYDDLADLLPGKRRQYYSVLDSSALRALSRTWDRVIASMLSNIWMEWQCAEIRQR